MSRRFVAHAPRSGGTFYKWSHLPLTRCVMICRGPRAARPEWHPLSWHTTPALAETSAARWPQYETRVVVAFDEPPVAPVPEARD